MFPLPTCPLRSAPRTIPFSFDTLSVNPSRFCQKSFFSSMLLLTCGTYALTIFRMDSYPPALWPLVCLTKSSPPGHFQPATKSCKQRELIVFIFKAILCSILECASNIWSFIISNTNIIKLQTIQNTALQILTGCTQDTIKPMFFYWVCISSFMLLNLAMDSNTNTVITLLYVNGQNITPKKYKENHIYITITNTTPHVIDS